MELNRLEQLLIEDLKIYGSQKSRDWDADYRIARYLRIPYTYGNKKVTRKRQEALRSLIAKGYVSCRWEGTGLLGKSIYGVCRLKSYGLIK